MALKIIDVSHWQENINWPETKVDVAIIKATQGISFLDNKLAHNKEECRKNGILLGYYHFTDGGDAIKEADWFVKNIGNIQAGEFLVLDFEINLLGAGNWCRRWLDRVKEKTGVRPMLYTNEARVKSIDWREVVAGNYGLWVARYYLNTGYKPPLVSPSSGQWPFWAIWQYTSRGRVDGIAGNVDMNYTKMDIETLRKYGKQGEQIQCPYCKKYFNK